MSFKTPAAGVMQPVTFSGLFGCLHPAPGAAMDTGLVMVSPIGRDARCVHGPMRLLADQLAARGYPTLRYDHRGEGDSLPLPDDADAVQIWLQDIERAIDQLRDMTGVRRVVLAGVRLGAAFAYVKAAQADGLILLAPVLSGRSWLRQQQFAMQAGRDAQPTSSMALDVDGVVLNAATAAGLSSINLQGVAVPDAPVLIAAQNALSANFATALIAGGAAVTQIDFPGFDDLFLDTHSNKAPHAVFDRVSDWMADRFAAVSFIDDHLARRAITAPPLSTEDFTERPVSFGADLLGVLNAPHKTNRPSTGVIFCNTGGEPRAGIGGFATSAARRLASIGVMSLRFDFAGLGDSPAPRPLERTHIYETPRHDDLASAIAFLKSVGRTEIYLVGVCSGAYHVLLETENEAVCGIFAVSPARLTWRDGDALTFGRKDQGRATHAYVSAVLSRDAWRRLLQGKIDVYTVLRTMAARYARRWALSWRCSAPQSPGSILQTFLARGGRAIFLMGLDDSSLDEVNTHFGPAGARVVKAGDLTIRVEPSLDHGLARSASRELALSALMDWLQLTPATGSPG